MKHFLKPLLLFAFLGVSAVSYGATDSTQTDNKQDFQIHLKSPAKTIRLLMYEKNFVPIQGTLSEDKKSIIIKNYEPGSKVHVKVEYEDGSVEEFVRSPCFIDPVITMNSFLFNSN